MGGVLREWNGTDWVDVLIETAPGAAGGDLIGTYPNPTIKPLAITEAHIAVAYKDGLGSIPSLRTLGPGVTQAASGDDSRFTNARIPTGTAGGDLDGTYPNPTIYPGAVDATAISPLIKDAAAVNYSLRTLGTNATQAAAGNDTRFTDARIPTGTAGGDLAGTYPNPTIKPLSIVDGDIAVANKDGIAATPSMRTLGTGAQQAAAGNDTRFTDARIPTGTAGGDLAGTYPNPTIKPLSIVDGDIAVANKDGIAATPSMRTLGTGAQQAVSGTDARLADARTPLTHNQAASTITGFDAAADARITVQKAQINGLASLDASGDIPIAQIPTGSTGTTVPLGNHIHANHAATHEPGGSDSMDVDGPAATGTLRSLGNSPQQAAAGNDSRFSDARTPTAHNQSADTITASATKDTFLLTERTKLTNIATAATANATDVSLRDRATHTGYQDATTISGTAMVGVNNLSEISDLMTAHANLLLGDAAKANFGTGVLEVAEGNHTHPVDAAAATGSLRTLGTGALQATAGNDSRLVNARTPTGVAGGVLSGSYPNPEVASQFAFRNKIINGDFRINQRGYITDYYTLNAGMYGFDRWKSMTSSNAMIFTSDPTGQIVIIPGNGAFAQIIERANIAAGIYTLSWVGTVTARVYNVGSTAPAYSTSPIIVALDSLADVTVEFYASVNPGTLHLVQLEPGSVATPFEYRPLSVELAMCQRYFIRIGGHATEYSNIGIGIASSTTLIRVSVSTPPMRGKPTATRVGTLQGGILTGVVNVFGSGSWSIFIDFNAIGAVTGASSIAYVNPGTGNYLDFAAEL